MQFYHHEGQPWSRRGFPTANPCSCLPLRRNLVHSSVDFRVFFCLLQVFPQRTKPRWQGFVASHVLDDDPLSLGDIETLSFNFRFRWNWEANKFCLPEGVKTRVSHRTWLASVCPVVHKCALSKGQQETLNAAAKTPFTARLPEITRQRTPRGTRPPGC